MKKIRVLEIINEATIGGGQKHLLELVRNLNRNQFDVIVTCSDNGPLIEELKKSNIKAIPTVIKKNANPRAIYSIYRILKKYRIDLLHTHGGVAGLWGRLAGLLAGTRRIVHTLHGIHYLNYPNPLSRYLFILLDRMLSLFTDAIICVAESDRKKGLAHKVLQKNKSYIIRNGVSFPDVSDTFTTSNKKRELGIPMDAPIVGNIARLHHQKGHIYLLEATKKLIQTIPDLVVLIVGDGEQRGYLESRSQQLGLEGHVMFLGFRQDIPELLSVMDVFVLSSLWEGLPITLLEALALGKPVVSTRVDGVVEIIEEGQEGRLVPPANPDRLARAILELLKNKELARRMGLKGREKVLMEFSIAQMVKQTEEVYRKLF